jgi:hypothetical protein
LLQSNSNEIVRISHKLHKYVEYHKLELGFPNPSPASEYDPHPESKGGAHSPTGEGLGDPNSDDLRKGLVALCLLCGISHSYIKETRMGSSFRDDDGQKTEGCARHFQNVF